MRKTDNRARLRALIERAGITQREAAEIISRESGDAVSLRLLQRWLADPELSSSLACPGWAGRLLEIGLAGGRG